MIPLIEIDARFISGFIAGFAIAFLCRISLRGLLCLFLLRRRRRWRR